jgi:hypothetical protein
MKIFPGTANLDELRLDMLLDHPLTGDALDRFLRDDRNVYRETGI